MTRRRFFAALLPILGANVPNVTAAPYLEGGFIVSGLASASDTERAEGFLALGQDVAVIVRDQAIYERQIAPLAGKSCRLTLVED